MRRTQKSARSQRGFTLIELLTVFMIIALLAGVTAVYLNQARSRARIGRAQGDLRTIALAIHLLETDTNLRPGRFDATQCVQLVDGNEVALNTEDGGLIGTGTGYAGWNGKYLHTEPIDPWENPYWYDHDYDCSVASALGCEDQPQWVEAVVSSGPNNSAIDVYDDDNIVRVRCK